MTCRRLQQDNSNPSTAIVKIMGASRNKDNRPQPPLLPSLTVFPPPQPSNNSLPLPTLSPPLPSSKSWMPAVIDIYDRIGHKSRKEKSFVPCVTSAVYRPLANDVTLLRWLQFEMFLKAPKESLAHYK